MLRPLPKNLLFACAAALGLALSLPLTAASGPAAPEPRIDIRAVGDTGFIGGNGVFKRPPAAWVKNRLAALEPLRSPDINLLNLEGTLTASCQTFADRRYKFAIAPEFVLQLADWGFNAIALANNHSGDCVAPRSGRALALQKIRRVYPDLALTGTAASASLLPRTVGSLVVRDVRVGIAAIKGWPSDARSPIANLKNRKPIFTSLQQGPYDVRILSLHGGTERERRPAADIIRTAREFIGRYDGDIVFAHHPHVMQGIELLRKRDGRYGVVFYSLGNHLHNGLSTAGDGLMARVVATRSGIDPRSLQMFPLGKSSTQPVPLSGFRLAQAAAIIERSSLALLDTPPGAELTVVPFSLQINDSPAGGLQVLPNAAKATPLLLSGASTRPQESRLPAPPTAKQERRKSTRSELASSEALPPWAQRLAARLQDGWENRRADGEDLLRAASYRLQVVRLRARRALGVLTAP